jgi:hypothetical protein
MRRLLRAMHTTAAAVVLLSSSIQADTTNDGQATVDKAIQALGGEATLKSTKAYTWKSKGKINIGGTESAFTSEATVAGLDRFRQTFEGEFNGEKVKGVTVINGDKGWRKFGEMGMELDKDAMAIAKRSVYLEAVSGNPLLLKEKGFKIQSAPDEQFEGKDVACVKVTGPDGKDFTILFDKTTGLPVKEVAKVIGFGGEEVTQETIFKEYKVFDGFKTATKVEIKHDGQKFLDGVGSDFRRLDNVDAKTFENPL